MKANESDAAKLAFLDGIDPSEGAEWAAAADAVVAAQWWPGTGAMLEALVGPEAASAASNGNALRLALELDPSVYRGVRLDWDWIVCLETATLRTYFILITKVIRGVGGCASGLKK